MSDLRPEHIPNPCHENLTPLDDGSGDHWCDKCAHRIPDLTEATLAEVEKIREIQGGKVCGIIRVKRAALTGATAAGLALASCQQPAIQGGIQPHQTIAPSGDNQKHTAGMRVPRFKKSPENAQSINNMQIVAGFIHLPEFTQKKPSPPTP